MEKVELSEELFATLPSGIRICYQTMGKQTDPAVLIINGFGGSMTTKTEGLLAHLSPPHSPHFVIRFDHRDTGRSTAIPVPEDGFPAYSLDDMVNDVVGLIDYLELQAVHLIGSSMGGALAYAIAGQRIPEKVKSLSLIFTSPVGPVQNEDDNLPPHKEEGEEKLMSTLVLPSDFDDHEGWVDLYTTIDLALAFREPTDEEKAEAREQARICYNRERESGTLWTKGNHRGAANSRWPREALKGIKCPTVVIHAEGDQFWSIEHSEALRDGIAGSRLVVIKNCGHEFPRRIWKETVEEVLENIYKGEAAGKESV
jgi:pimeloyl-ACP methyl ester carboxylesterase